MNITIPMTAQEALYQGLREEMQRDERVMIMGEGVATLHPDLVQSFGAQRVRNTPLSEAIVAGCAVGAAASGLRPVIDMLYAPFLTYAMDALVNSAGKLRYMSGGQFSFPLVTLAQTGAGWGVGAQHSHNLEAWFVHCPGLKVLMPATPADLKGLIKSAIRDDNPVVLLTDMTLGYQPGDVPTDPEHLVPIGQARVARAGRDLTLVSYSKAVHTCLAAAQALAAQGVEAEVIDLRSLKPLDMATVLRSVRRTGRLMVVHEAGPLCGLGAEIAAQVAEQAFSALRAPVRRITSADVPTPASHALEQAFAPGVDAIVEAALTLTQDPRPAQAA
ncbi:MAG TPA: pyruvate dehydrogenase complex E1 component subunit beta [Aquabacterium sp.]|uniref:alpha-ketoacid dehydrogenase subunit beta n=1 Tax=Aquabacterium sp. TaxID=1872578 RepID=UPI002E2EF3F8|nr:pyruvate dehydrogenase complex E1 component subunit beta [Aquabacterium sp.]HEX5374163.1 pyruvate dehydrogenase complex E1 component subunit beta [Aquabacterium sp.]